jgi:IS605 OrfB family transposase
MTTITLVSKIIANPSAEAILLEAMHSATKVFNGMVWHLRKQYEEVGKAPISRQNLNKIMKELPRRKEYYSLSAQATRDEVIGAYKSYFALQKKGDEKARPPGFRKRKSYSNLRYYDGYGFEVLGNKLKLRFGRSRLDGVKEVEVEMQGREDVQYTKVRNVVITYDKKLGLQAHLVVDVEDQEPLGDRVAAVDLGETQIMSAMFDDGTTLLYSGREIKAIRRYWNKVRRQVKPPQEGQRKSRRYKAIERKENRQVNHRLHQISKDFVSRCYETGVATIVLGDLTGIRENIQYGTKTNQRLHAWSFAKLMDQIKYKAAMKGIKVVEISEAYTSQTCHQCGKITKSNRKHRGFYQCSCGWSAHADINSAANIFERFSNVSPLKRSSGAVAAPVVLPLRNSWHTVYEPTDAPILWRLNN